MISFKMKKIGGEAESNWISQQGYSLSLIFLWLLVVWMKRILVNWSPKLVRAKPVTYRVTTLSGGIKKVWVDSMDGIGRNFVDGIYAVNLLKIISVQNQKVWNLYEKNN